MNNNFMFKNPLEIIKMIKNPKQYVMNIAKQTPNPMLDNLIKMAESGDQKGVENFARNVMKEQGMDFDKEYNDIMSTFK